MTGTPILAELIDRVNSIIIFQSQMTLLRWLTFLPGSLTLFELFLSSDASICSTMAFPELANSDQVASVSINFPINSKQDDLFYFIPYDCSRLVLIRMVFMII